MTDISESGIELLPCPFCGKQPEVRDFIARGAANYVQIECSHFAGDPDADECTYSVTVNADTLELAAEAWNRRHPPASREDGLISVLDAYDAETAKVPLGHENRSLGASTYNWRRAIVSELRALIPTKPEAKEPTAPEPPTGEEELAWEAYVAKFDDSSYGKPTSTDFWPWLKHRRALQSKKPE